ncbi:hypothetical protein Tco_0767525 [Tanacetum coccineum]
MSSPGRIFVPNDLSKATHALRVVVVAAKMNQQTIDNDLESFFSFRASSAPAQAAQWAIPVTSMKVVVIHRIGDADEDEYEKSDEIDYKKGERCTSSKV